MPSELRGEKKRRSSKLAAFDGQAATFDERAGLPDGDCPRAAQAVFSMSGCRPGDLIVEVGAGTGQIGQWFADLSVRYVGLDSSAGMLARFRQRPGPEGGARWLLQADAGAFWPLADSCAAVVFSSRTLHLLRLEHVVEQIRRIARPQGSALILGWVRRPDDSLRSALRAEMRLRLASRGFEARGGSEFRRRLLDALGPGTVALGPAAVASWPVSDSVGSLVEQWSHRVGLAGVHPPAAVKKELLAEIEAWAVGRFGDPARLQQSREEYVLSGILFPSG